MVHGRAEQDAEKTREPPWHLGGGQVDESKGRLVEDGRDQAEEVLVYEEEATKLGQLPLESQKNEMEAFWGKDRKMIMLWRVHWC